MVKQCERGGCKSDGSVFALLDLGVDHTPATQTSKFIIQDGVMFAQHIILKAFSVTLKRNIGLLFENPNNKAEHLVSVCLFHPACFRILLSTMADRSTLQYKNNAVNVSYGVLTAEGAIV